MEYTYTILVYMGIYIILSVSLNLLVGVTGILSIAQAAFYGIGAYITALMCINFNTSLFPNLIISINVAVLAGYIVGLPSIKLRNDYFMIATFSFQILFFNVVNNLVEITGGPMGLSGISSPEIFGLKISTHLQYLVLTTLFASAVYLFSKRLINSPFGRVLTAIREDEIFALSTGKNINAYKIAISVISAALASVAGVLYAGFIRFVDPTGFTLMESVFILSMVIIGGVGKMNGAVIGAVILIVLQEGLTFVGFPTSIESNVRQILYGALMIAFLMWRPQGLVGNYSFKKGYLPQ